MKTKTLQQITNSRKEYLASKIRALDFVRTLRSPLDLTDFSEINPSQLKLDRMRDFYHTQLIKLMNSCIKSVNGNTHMPYSEKLKMFNLFGV